MRNNKKLNVILALFIAIGLWIYVFGQSNSTIKTTIKDIPINVINEEILNEDGYAISSIDGGTVNITFTGQRLVTSKLTESDFSVTCDVSNLTEGESVVRLDVVAPDDVTISNISLQSVRVAVESQKTEEKDISVVIINDNSDETEPYVVQLSHTKVDVSGASSLVDSVDKVTAYLDASKVTDEMQAFNVELVSCDSNGDIISGLDLSIDHVSITAIMAYKKTVPLGVPIYGEEKVKYERTVSVPQAITIKAIDQDVLNEIESIEAKTLDISEIYESCEMDIVFELPEDVSIASDSVGIVAKVTVKGASKRVFTYTETDIVTSGVMEDINSTIDNVNIDVTVCGSSTIVDNMTKEDIKLTIDVSNLYLGEFEVPVTFTCEKSVDSITPSTEVVTVNVE